MTDSDRRNTKVDVLLPTPPTLPTAVPLSGCDDKLVQRVSATLAEETKQRTLEVAQCNNWLQHRIWSFQKLKITTVD